MALSEAEMKLFKLGEKYTCRMTSLWILMNSLHDRISHFPCNEKLRFQVFIDAIMLSFVHQI